MRSPEDIAAEIVDRYTWPTRIVEVGCVISEKASAKAAIADAIRADRIERQTHAVAINANENPSAS